MPSPSLAPLYQRVVDHMAPDTSGHDHHHALRVVRTALHLARAEGADPLVVELAALLHDVDDYKLTGGDGSPVLARRWMTEHDVARDVVDEVCEIIIAMSACRPGAVSVELTPEGRCVQDADWLDAMGAIGIARTFAYGGAAGRTLHDPAVEVAHHDSLEAYRSHDGTTVNHFHEKLLLIADHLHTDAARALAAVRQRRMLEFLEAFTAEWDGTDLPAGWPAGQAASA